MGEFTAISWCDSTLNLMMGCDGCELSSNGNGSGTCYAETLTNFRGGKNKGWPTDFFSPEIFPSRLEKALKWPDLTGTTRPGRPWFDGLPRHVFPDDLGDTFTESLPIDWLAPHVPKMETSPFIYMFLTKRPERMYQFFRAYGHVPKNFMLGTSCIASMTRVRDLIKIEDARLWVSAEPLWAPLDFRPWLSRLSLIVVGGESGPRRREMEVSWAQSIREQCRAAGVAFFMKQDSGPRAGMQGRLPDDLWNAKEMPR